MMMILIRLIRDIFYSKVRCLFFEHEGPLIFNRLNNTGYIKCKWCGNEGNGYVIDEGAGKDA